MEWTVKAYEKQWEGERLREDWRIKIGKKKKGKYRMALENSKQWLLYSYLLRCQCPYRLQLESKQKKKKK